MNKPMTLDCLNCREPFTAEPLRPIEREMLAQGGHCPACCATAERYYQSDAYKAFEESEL